MVSDQDTKRMEDPNFRQALEVYRTNYLEYKVTGKPEYKVAYENAQSVIEQYLANLQKKIGNDASYVDNFVKQYANSNETLMKLRDQSRAIQKEGPALQDKYDATRRIQEKPAEPTDYTSFYVKGALIAGVASIAAIASSLRT